MSFSSPELSSFTFELLKITVVFQFIWLNPFFLILLNTQVTNISIRLLHVIVFWAVENVIN